MRSNKSIKVSLLATPDTSPSTLFGIFDVLSSVGIGWETFVSGSKPSPKFDVSIVAVDKKPFLCGGCGGSVLITPHLSTDEAFDTDIAIVGSFIAPDSLSIRQHDEREVEWLMNLEDQGALLSAMCTSSVLLAEAGILDGYDATTFWVYRDLARIRYPKVNWRIDQVLCVGGSNDQIVTAGGATVWQELVLYLIERYCGVEQANNAAKLWVIPNRTHGQQPFATRTISHSHDDKIIGRCQTWAEENYSAANPVKGMIGLSGLASSTFARRFRQATGERPIDYIHMLRLEKAKDLLEENTRNIDEIGKIVGYEDPTSFRRIFKRKIGMAPKTYRLSFGEVRFTRN